MASTDSFLSFSSGIASSSLIWILPTYPGIPGKLDCVFNVGDDDGDNGRDDDGPTDDGFDTNIVCPGKSDNFICLPPLNLQYVIVPNEVLL